MKRTTIVTIIEFSVPVLILFLMIKIGRVTGKVETTGFDYWGNPITEYVYHKEEFPPILKTILRIRFYSGLVALIVRYFLMKYRKYKVAGILTIPFLGVVGGILTYRSKETTYSKKSRSNASSSYSSSSYDRDYGYGNSSSSSSSYDDIDTSTTHDNSDYGPKISSNIDLNTGERGYSIDDRHYDSHGNFAGYDVDDRHYDSSGHSTGYRSGDTEYDDRGNAIGYWNGDDFHKY